MARTEGTIESFASGLRALADYLETRPDLVELMRWQTLSIDLFPKPKERFLELATSLGGNVEKKALNDWFWVEKRFGDHVKLALNFDRKEVCTRVVKETRILPAEPARAVLLDAKPERVEEIVEWQCPDSLLALAKAKREADATQPGNNDNRDAGGGMAAEPGREPAANEAADCDSGQPANVGHDADGGDSDGAGVREEAAEL